MTPVATRMTIGSPFEFSGPSPNFAASSERGENSGKERSADFYGPWREIP
jgi:hypothetical protein